MMSLFLPVNADTFPAGKINLPNPDSLPILLDPRLQPLTFSPPEGLELVKAEKNLVSIKWKDTAVIETLYVVERKTENGSYAEIKVLPKDSVSFEDITVEPGITYYYRVKAGKEEQNSATGKMEIKYSAYSNELKVTTPTSDGSTTGGPIKDIKIIGEVKRPSLEVKPKLPDISIKPDLGTVLGTGTDTETDTSTGTGTETGTGSGIGKFLELGIDPGSLTKPGAITIPGSGTESGTITDTETTPGTQSQDATISAEIKAPEGLVGEAISENQIALAWQDKSDNELGFLLYRTATGEWEEAAVLNANTTEYVDANLLPNTTYYYVLFAYNETSISTESNFVEITTPKAAQTQVTAPAAPEALAAEAKSPTEVVLTWIDKSDNEQGFIIYRTSTGEWEQAAVVSANTTTYTDINLKPNTTYYYAVFAYRDSSFSAQSNIAEVLTTQAASTALTAPEGLTAQAQKPNEVLLTWQDKSDNEDGFLLYRTSTGDWEVIATLGANVTTFTDIAVQPNTKYYYVVYAFAGETPSTESNMVEITTPSQTTATTVDFTGASSWALEELKKAVDYGLYTDRIMNNYTQSITREEFCELVVKLYEKLKGIAAVPVSPNPFIDTSNENILKAYGAGIVTGTSANTFSPNNLITRQDICVMLYRAITGSVTNVDTNIDGVPAFTDENLIGQWAVKEVKFAVKNNIMQGSASKIMPRDNTTREQAVLLVVRVYERFTDTKQINK